MGEPASLLWPKLDQGDSKEPLRLNTWDASDCISRRRVCFFSFSLQPATKSHHQGTERFVALERELVFDVVCAFRDPEPALSLSLALVAKPCALHRDA